MIGKRHVLAALLSLAATPAWAETGNDRFAAGGYFRVSTRPDFAGGDGKLGYYNLYGRLMNEGPYAALEMRLDMLQKQASRANQPWTSIHAKVEGGSVANADPRGGRLENFALTQLYAKAGNVGIPGVTWQLGTLDSYFGDLGLYDMKPAQIFFDTVGLSARYERPRYDLLVGAGDAGYFIRREEYDTIFTGGGSLRVRVVPGHFEVGGGGQLWHEPGVRGNRLTPHSTNLDGASYEDYARGEVVENHVLANPGFQSNDIRYTPRSNTAWKAVGYVGFGAGPLKWNNFFMNVQKKLPETTFVETFDFGAGPEEVTLYEAEFTDERYQLNIGNEMHVTLVPQRLDIGWGLVYGEFTDGDNDIVPSDDDQTIFSTLVRAQLYVTPTVHVLAEGVVAKETSHNGNRYRNHEDSIFQSENGQANADGLEMGDADVRDTLQGKFGLVLNPAGVGLFNRPSLRVLYGVQWSSQNNAFGNSFSDDVNDDSRYGTQERHLHHVLGFEAEAWF